MTGDKKQALGLDSLSGVLTDGNITSKPWSLQEGVQYRLVEYTGWLSTQVGWVHRLVEYTGWLSTQVGWVHRLVEYTGWLGTQVGLSTKGIKEVRSPLSPLTSAGHPVPLQWFPPSS